MGLKEKLQHLFKHDVLFYNLTIDELMKKRERASTEIFMNMGNSIITAGVAGWFYWAEYQHFAIIFIIISLMFMISILDDKWSIYQIDMMIYMKNQEHRVTW
jgi:hypothetical protein